ncbi:NERD domain-containing protein [Streptomyces bauhiniae]|uniref:NERD domain-containing protein n=1 Tax=Streptomyces bauhiniae TaxID=2340725 RepID=A0A4Z1DGY2_9ACTN|nr:NERD domain-containing protein [Streptomyces bauhiniae]TGN81631.1 NERD domain-containing protein [Streptomyces bauhiniae]
MSGLRVVPSRGRLYVCDAGGGGVAWYDRGSGRVSLLVAERERDVLDALKPFLTGPVTLGPPLLPDATELARLTLPPDDDLAPNRPGEALLVALDRDPAPKFRADPRRRALLAEQVVGAALEQLEGAGCRTLHSVPLPGGGRIPHLLVGPAGLFAVGALYARGRRVRVSGPLVAVGRRAPEPLPRRLRADAERAAYALTAGVGPVLVVVGPAEVSAEGLRVLRETELPGLARPGAVLRPSEVEALYARARDRRTWAVL